MVKSKPTPKMNRAITLVMMGSPLRRGFSSITSLLGGSEASASAAKVSMIRFTHSICVTVSAGCSLKNEHMPTSRLAATLTVSWKRMNRCMFLYNERPHITALPMLAKELSMMVMSLASLATEVPSPIDRPTCAALSAGASLVPSPVTATTSPCCCSSDTSRALSAGRARDMIFIFSARWAACASGRAANSSPDISASLLSSSFHNPTCRPISQAVPGVSPVTIFTCRPASRHSCIAPGTSLRTGSLMATMPMKVMPSTFNLPSAMGQGASLSSIL